jgi:hypothetical protein
MTARLTVKHSSALLVMTTIFLAMSFTASGFATAATLFQDDFNSYTSIKDLTSSGEWSFVTSYATLESEGCYNGKCLRIPYPGIETFRPVEKDISSSNASALYVKFRFKITGSGIGGVKFLKLFGKLLNESTQAEYANNTWNLGNVTATSSNLHSVCYGNGQSLQNDTDVCVYFDGSIGGNPGSIVYQTKTNLFYPVINTWYQVEMYQKYNTNGNRDGEYWIKINNNNIMRITNVKNRNDSNIGEFRMVSFGDYSNRFANFDLYFDDISISTTPIDDTTSTTGKSPAPPSKLQIN